MGKVRCLVIDFRNLTEREQIRLFLCLHKFANEQLPVKKSLNAFTISNQQEKKKRRKKNAIYYKH